MVCIRFAVKLEKSEACAILVVLTLDSCFIGFDMGLLSLIRFLISDLQIMEFPALDFGFPSFNFGCLALYCGFPTLDSRFAMPISTFEF